jgi:OmcA/MtrC family decaheme c-type cytochrome
MTTSKLLQGGLQIALATMVFAACGGGGGGHPKATATATPTVTPIPTVIAGAGLQSAITDASADATGVVTTTFTVTDGNGVPLIATLSAAQNNQQARVRLTMAGLEQYSGGGELGNTFFRYVNEINAKTPAFDSKGTLELVDAATGTYRYTFAKMLPDGYDPTQTYTVGMQVDRTFAGQQLGVNPVFDFVPNGGMPQIWEDTTTAQCNQCHQPLIAHGNRREVRLCKLCHTEAATDAKGTSIDFRNMVHQIHAGKDLPLVNAGPPGTQYAIFSSFLMQYVVFAQKQADGSVTGVGFPRFLEECATCHSDGPTAAFFREKPATAACATCHDDVNPSLDTTPAGPPGTNHPPGAYADGQCSACHAATQNQEFDISVPGAHVVPERSTMLQGLNIAITDVTNHTAGSAPTISFRITDDAGTPLTDLSGLNRVGFALSGPTTDYTTVLTPTAVGGGASGMLTGPDASGVFQYTPPAPIPAGATGTWAVGAEVRQMVQLTQAVSAEEAAVNPVVTFSVDGSAPVPHRTIVDTQKCATCHGEFSKDFSIHGNLRNQVSYCELCHNSTQSDVGRRRRDPAAVAAGEMNQPIDFKVMIHKIHRGDELAQQPYLIYGFGPPPQNYSINDFGDVRYPGDLRICSTCHVNNSQLIPPYPSTALPTLQTMLDPATGNPIPSNPPEIAPITAVCTSCHDDDAAIAHAETQTAPNGIEACPVCHEEGAAFAVSIVHAGRN